MDGTDRGRRWTHLKQRLGFNGMCFCGDNWSSTPSTTTTTLTILESRQEIDDRDQFLPRVEVGPSSASTRAGSEMMNLEMLLAAERSLQPLGLGPTNNGEVKSLMRLFEETDGVAWIPRRKSRDRGIHHVDGNPDWLCCVCMDRSKGAAFIPCGHAFCRFCSRELWRQRASCPVCNRRITDILEIY